MNVVQVVSSLKWEMRNEGVVSCSRTLSTMARTAKSLVYRVMVLERGSKYEKRKLILAMLGINDWAFRWRVNQIVAILNNHRTPSSP